MSGNALSPEDDFIRFRKEEIEQSIPDRFEQQVLRRPNHAAIKTRFEQVTYAQLNARANGIAWALLDRGDAERAPVAVLLEQGVLLIAAILGVLKTGRPYVGLDPGHPPASLQRTLHHCGADLILTHRALVALARKLAAAGQTVIALDEPGSVPRTENPVVVRSPDDPAYIYYTSGTTGVPKGVVDIQRNVLHNVMRYTNNLRIGQGDRLTLLQSVAFSGAVSSLFCALLNSATSHPIDFRTEGIQGLADRIRDEAITVYHSVPSIFQQLVRTGRRFPSLRVIRLEGDQASWHHIELFQAHFGPETTLVNGLGATETGISHQFPVTSETRLTGGVVPVGYATEDMAAVILDGAGRPIPAGEVGEIAIRSRFLAVGYWRAPELTAGRFLPDPVGGKERLYRTGDFGYLHPDGCLVHLGRREGSFRLKGRWVDGPAIEAALLHLPAVREAAVVVQETSPGCSELVAHVVAADDPAPTVSALRAGLRAQGLTEALPSRYVFLPRLPLDVNGKVQRSALPVPALVRPSLDVPFEAPASALERTLAEIWREVLCVDQVGRHDQFDDLGGDSLQVVEIAMLMEQHLGRPVPDSWLLEAPSIASLAQLAEGSVTHDGVTVVPLARLQGRRPLFLVHDGTGDVVVYSELARTLAEDWDVFGLRAPGLEGHSEPLDRVEALASACVGAIRGVQADGPYVLGGNCFGGMVAYETARQLREEGAVVERLLLIDTGFPVGYFRSRFRRHRRWLSRLSLRGKVEHLVMLGGSVLVRLGVRLRRSFVPAGADAASPSPAESVLAANRRALWRYRARPCDAPAVLIYAGRPHNQLEWCRVLRTEPRLIALPDDVQDRHLVQAPNVAPLADALREVLRRGRVP